jgi:hypothetical protein
MVQRAGISAMLGSCSRVIALTAMVAGLSMTAQAAEPATLTLACQGTMKSAWGEPRQWQDAKPVSMGLIVNFTARTVTGFTSPSDDFPVTITTFDDVHILFGGSNKSGDWKIVGSIDRVTGDVTATYNEMIDMVYELKCRPTQRMF